MRKHRDDMQVNVAGLRRNIKNLAHNYSEAQVRHYIHIYIYITIRNLINDKDLLFRLRSVKQHRMIHGDHQHR